MFTSVASPRNPGLKLKAETYTHRCQNVVGCYEKTVVTEYSRYATVPISGDGQTRTPENTVQTPVT
jgi:hypothetical protein